MFSEIFLIQIRIQQTIIVNVHSSSSKVPVVLFFNFKETSIVSTDFQKILKYRISRKSFQWEQSCSIRKGRQREANRRKLKVYCVVLPSHPKMGSPCSVVQHKIFCNAVPPKKYLALPVNGSFVMLSPKKVPSSSCKRFFCNAVPPPKVPKSSCKWFFCNAVPQKST